MLKPDFNVFSICWKKDFFFNTFNILGRELAFVSLNLFLCRVLGFTLIYTIKAFSFPFDLSGEGSLLSFGKTWSPGLLKIYILFFYVVFICRVDITILRVDNFSCFRWSLLGYLWKPSSEWYYYYTILHRISPSF